MRKLESKQGQKVTNVPLKILLSLFVGLFDHSQHWLKMSRFLTHAAGQTSCKPSAPPADRLRSKPNWTGEKTPEWTSPVLFVCPGISLCCPHVSPIRLAARLTTSNPSTQIRGFNEGNLVSCTGSALRDSRVCEGLQAEADIMLSDAREAQT